MIRWRYLIPRLMIVVILVVIVHMAASPVAGWVAKIAYERSTGGRLDIADAHVGFFPPKIVFRGVQMGDPRHEKENIAEFDRIELAFNGTQLLHRRWVIDEARLAGIRFSSERETVGRIERQESASPSDGPGAFDGMLGSIGEWLEDSAKTKSDAMVERLQTVQLSRALEDQWKTRFVQEKMRAERIETTVRSIRDNVRAIDNPLRDLPRVQQAITEAQRLQLDLAEARRVLTSTPNQLQFDLQQMEAARQADMQQLRQFLPVEGPIENVGQVTDALLRKFYLEPLETARSYLALGRDAADLTVKRPKPARVRGIDFDLDNRSQDPFLAIRRCELSGNISIDRTPYVLTGLIDDYAISDNPSPIRVRLKLEGAQEIRLDYHRELGQPLTHQLAVHVPRLPCGDNELKAGKYVTLRTAAVPLQLWANIQTDGERLEGRLIAKQVGASVQAHVHGDHEAIQLMQAAFNRSLGSVHELQFDAQVGGSWDRPTIQAQSNLGEAIRVAFQEAQGQALAFAENKVREEIDRAHRKQAAQLEAVVAAQQAELDRLLARVESEVQDVSAKIAGQLNRSPFQMGQLPNLMTR